MDATQPLVATAQTKSPYMSYAAGAALATTAIVGIAAVNGPDTYARSLLFQAVAGTACACSFYGLQTVRDASHRANHSRQFQAHYQAPDLAKILGDQQQARRVGSTLTGLSAVLGATSVGLAAAGTAFALPTTSNIMAAFIGCGNIGAAVLHFYEQPTEPVPVPQTAYGTT
ncbi:MAG: hypothetical protein EOO40_08205 [Deltaproteobacteria bacterium]|nr:MAG: hypothetical protein EOO40_08205 [Deltaproteobacteria bacterium]